MASNITETDTYEANVVGPDDGDAVDALSVRNGLQDLANRTTYLKGRRDEMVQEARYTMSGTGLSSGSKVTLAQDFASSGFTLSSNEVEVPGAGTYLVSVYGYQTTDSAANPETSGLSTRKAGAIEGSFYGTRFSATTTHPVHPSATMLVQIATASTDKISVTVAGSGNISLTATAGFNRLSIVRIS